MSGQRSGPYCDLASHGYDRLEEVVYGGMISKEAVLIQLRAPVKSDRLKFPRQMGVLA